MNSNSSPAFILDNAYSGIKTDKTKALVVFAISLLLALLLPTLYLLWRMKQHDQVEEPCDLPAEFEARSVSINEDNDWVNLASATVSKPGLKIIVLSDVTGNQAGKALTELERVSNEVTKHNVESIADLKKTEVSLPQDEIAVIKVDDWKNTAAWCRMLDPQATAVLILLNGKSLKRSEFTHYFGNINSDNCIIGFTE